MNEKPCLQRDKIRAGARLWLPSFPNLFVKKDDPKQEAGLKKAKVQIMKELEGIKDVEIK